MAGVLGHSNAHMKSESPVKAKRENTNHRLTGGPDALGDGVRHRAAPVSVGGPSLLGAEAEVVFAEGRREIATRGAAQKPQDDDTTAGSTS